MKNSIITRVVLLGTIAVAGILAVQSYWVVSTWNINEAEFNQKVHLALYNVASALADVTGSTLPARNVVKQRTTNYYVVNIANEINPANLEYFLQRELESLALNIDFEYAVFDCHTNEMVYGNYYAYDANSNKKAASGQLPTYSEFTYYFGVKFPTRSGYLFSKMQLSIIFSVILLVTVAFFAYSMFVILQQKRLSEMQKDFINNMTHEFKTPISTVKIAADVFLHNAQVQQDERLARYAHIIQEQNQRLNKQVENVLQIARLERDNFELNLEPIALNALLEEISDSCVLKIEKLGGHLETKLSGENIIIQADRLHLTNVLHNLLDNAMKYCKALPAIKVSLEKTQKGIGLSIEDNGIGIAKEYQSKVFEKFYRVPTGNVHDVKGFGLGLFYVKNICRKHGWKITLESEVNKGTKICILIPSYSTL